MPRIVRSSDAKRDLADIACFIALDNPSAAEGWLESVDRVLQLIAQNPEMGEAVDHLKPGLRRYTHGRYLLFYKPLSHGVLLYRVLHGARPIEELID